MPVTLKDIARRAGVTSATVSMVINNKPNISEATRKKVLKIAHDLNYYPNSIARGLATSRSGAIGVIVPNLASSFVVRVLQGIKSTNRDLNYMVLLFDTLGKKESEAQLFQRLSRERRIDGAILISSTVTDAELAMFGKEMVPSIVVARKCATLNCVYVNNEAGAADATDYLIEKGHRAIACVAANKKGLPMGERIAGYRRALARRGIPFREDLLFRIADDGLADGAAAFERIVLGPVMPTAVFVPAGDIAAIGIMKEARKRGIAIPSQLAVVGFDDIPAAEMVEPSLTTVRQPKLEMGDYAINMIIDKIEGRAIGSRQQELPTKFIVRESA